MTAVKEASKMWTEQSWSGGVCRVPGTIAPRSVNSDGDNIDAHSINSFTTRVGGRDGRPNPLSVSEASFWCCKQLWETPHPSHHQLKNSGTYPSLTKLEDPSEPRKQVQSPLKPWYNTLWVKLPFGGSHKGADGVDKVWKCSVTYLTLTLHSIYLHSLSKT